MNLTDGYSLYQIQEAYYLLPYGQNITMYRKGIQLNETGVLLWKALERGMSKHELLKYLADYYQTPEANYPALQSDIEQFLQQLASVRLISNDDEPLECVKHLRIGGIMIGYQGPEALLHPNLFSFLCKEDTVEQYWIVLFSPPEPLIRGELIIKTQQLEIFKCSKAYIINFTHASQLTQIAISLDGSKVRFYCYNSYSTDNLKEHLFHAFRYSYLFYAQRMGVFALHSSSILYKDKVWLLSASSGTGKTTQATYWQDLYQTPVLNGDLNLLSFSGEKPIVSGLPWCGTSEVYSNGTYPLGGIILLKQGTENTIQKLSKDQQQLSVAARLISPTWTAELLEYNLSFTQRLVEQVPVFRFICRKESEAAEQLHRYIDELLYKGY